MTCEDRTGSKIWDKVTAPPWSGAYRGTPAHPLTAGAIVIDLGSLSLGTLEIEEETDQVNHPSHYNAHPSGIECIDVVEHMGFNLGNAVKYIWRADEKGKSLEDLRKAAWYVNREIAKREEKNQ